MVWKEWLGAMALVLGGVCYSGDSSNHARLELSHHI